MTPITALEDLVKNAADMRGAVINDTILLERYIDEFIARYFSSTESKKVELMEMVFCTNKMTYIGKMELFVEILIKTKSPLLPSEPKKGEGGKKKFLQDLKDIGSIRNIFAHHMLDTSDEGVNVWINETTFRFIRFDKQSTPESYNQDRLNKDKELLMKYIGIVRGLIGTTPPPQTIE
jgi:hypothetical protein